MENTHRRGESTGERRYGVLSDRRGVSEVLGAILVFALVLAVLVLIQVAAVPAANQQVEFEHNQRVQGDLQEVDEAVARTGTTGAPGAIAIETGIRYPPRLFLLNPPPAAGAITTEPGSMQISNARAVDDETRDYLNSSLPAYDTVALSYTPNYNEYANPPTTRYEGWVMYNQFENANLVLDSGSFVNGRRVSITVLDGSLSTTSVRPTTLNTNPLSAPSQEVSVQGAGEPITLTFTSQLPASEWSDTLADEQYVDTVQQTGPDQVTITLQHMENGEVITYDLRMSKVGIGSRTTEPEATYVTKVGPASQLASASGTEFTVEVRDQFNNPVSGEDVTFTSPDGTFSNDNDNIVVSTDEDGHATALLTPGQGEQTVTVYAGRDITDPFGEVNGEAARNRVTFDNFQVIGGTQPPSPGDELNPASEGSVILENIERSATCKPLSDTGCTFDVTFRNSDDSRKSPILMRVNAYSAAAPGASGSDLPERLEVWDKNDDYTENRDLVIGSDYTDTSHLDELRESGNSEDTQVYSFLIRDSDGNRYEAAIDEFFYLTIKYDDGTKGTYLITL